MSILKPHTLAERVVTELKKGSARGPELMERLDRYDQHYTKQALYAALRQLQAEDVVVKQRGKFALNTTWIIQLQSFAQEAAYQYGTSSGGSEILALQEKESVSYVFTNSRSLDAFWGHAQNILLEHTPAHEPVYAYDPHYWFLLTRRETELALLKHIAYKKRQFFMAVGGTTTLDKVIAKDFDGTWIQYAHANLYTKPEYYVTAIGEYVTEVWIDPKLAQMVEDIYTKGKSAETTRDLEKLLSLRSRNKIKISRNKAKAEKIRKPFKKHFFIKK